MDRESWLGIVLIGFTLFIIALFIVAIIVTNNAPCSELGDITINNLPVRCLEYYNV